MPPDVIETAEGSLRRCQSEAFFRSFYSRLLASNPAIPPMFARTDFAKQHKLLQHSIGLLFVYAKRRNPAILERIAVRHGPREVNVPPDLYPHWVESLIATVREFDGDCNAHVEQAWRAAIAPGIEFLSGWYSRDAAGEGG